jgi:hypothetical protein
MRLFQSWWTYVYTLQIYAVLSEHKVCVKLHQFSVRMEAIKASLYMPIAL